MEIEIDYGLNNQEIGDIATRYETIDVDNLSDAVKRAEEVLSKAPKGSWAELFYTESGDNAAHLVKG